MTNTPSRAKPSLEAIIFLVISIAGFICYALYDKQVFPAASIDIKLSQKEAGEKSAKLAEAMGYDVAHCKHATTFTNDDEAKTVLEFNLGIDKANQLMKADVPVWLWHTRFCQELSKDEVTVTYTTHGQFKSIFHTFENDKKLPTISQDEALTLAKKYITETAGMDLNGYEIFDSGSEKKPNRTDYHFVWRKPGYKECEYRIRAEVTGNQVATCRWWLAPTDTWTRRYTEIRQWNKLLGDIASFGIFVFIAATIGAFVYGIAKHNVRWRFGLTAGAVVAVLTFLESINNFSYSLEEYNTSTGFNDFLLQTMITYTLLSVGAFVLSLLIAGGAETIYRSSRPAQMTMPNLLKLPGMAKIDFARKTIMGYLLVGVMMFWAIGYYKVGQHFGYFCPLGVDDYNVLGNYCPAISGALIGVSAAGLEEFTCRVVALGLLQKLTKNFWLSNLIQAVVWGFAHSSYPQQPCYARGIELTVVGLLFGYIIRKWGILPCFIAHYLYDAFLTVEPVFASHRITLIVPSLLILVPFVVAVLYSRHWSKKAKAAVEEIDMTNGAEQPAAPPSETEAPPHEMAPFYAALSVKQRKVLTLVAVLCAGILFIPGRDQIGKDRQLTISPNQAVALADKYMAEDGLDHKEYMTAKQIYLQPDNSQDTDLNWQYAYEKLGYKKLKEVYDQVTPGMYWLVRFFRPQESKTFDVYEWPDGRKRYCGLFDIDEARGANLDENVAQAQVEAYLKKYRPELSPLTLDTKSKTAQPKRIDYKFDYLVPKYNAGDTPAKLHVETKGDKISRIDLDWDVPDDWTWPRKKVQWYQQVSRILRIVGLAAAAVAGLVWGVRVMRSTHISWRAALTAGLIWSAILAAGVLNSSVKTLMNYNTAETFESFLGQTVASRSIMVLVQSIGCLILSVMGFAALRKTFPAVRQQLHSWILLWPANHEQKQVRTNLWIDGAISSYALCAAFVALQSLQTMILSYFSPAVPLDIPGHLASILSTTVPAIDIVSFVLGWSICGPMALALFAGLWQQYLSTKAKTNSIILACAILWGIDSWYWQNCLVATIFLWYKLYLIFYFVRKVFAGNALAYVFATAEITSVLCLSDLLSHASKIAGTEIGLLIGIMALPAMLAVIFWRMDNKLGK